MKSEDSKFAIFVKDSVRIVKKWMTIVSALFVFACLCYEISSTVIPKIVSLVLK